MNESKATRYQRLHRRAGTAAGVSAVAAVSAIALTPLARWLSDFADTFAAGLSGGAHVVVSLGVFVALIVGAFELATLPAVLYQAIGVNRRYGQAAFEVEEVLTAQVHAAAMALPVALFAAGVVTGSVRAAGAAWWVVAGAVLALGLLAAIRGAPRVLSSLADVRPLTRQPLAERLAALARRAGVPVSATAIWDVGEATSVTALFAGFGRTRRILLASTIVRDWSDDEVVVVVAHELAHYVHRDLWRSLAFNAVVLWVGLGVADLALRRIGPGVGVSGPADLAALPLIALVAGVVWIAAAPLRHAQSRRQERRADAFALAATGAVDAFRAAVQRLGDRHLAEERPAALTRWLYYSHPSVAERLALADAYRRVQSSWNPPHAATDTTPAGPGPPSRSARGGR